MVRSEDSTTRGITTVIVCPTPAGGHIEHACDLAIATYRATGRKAILLTRPGAKEYLPAEVGRFVTLLEIIPPLVENSSPGLKLMKILRQFARLFVEHGRIRQVLKSIDGPKVLLLEESRYPFPKILNPDKRTRICLVAHNVVEHSGAAGSITSKLRERISAAARSQFDYIAVHGERQMRKLKVLTRVPVQSFPLPGASYVAQMVSREDLWLEDRFPDISETFVCIGEIRANKGIEIALEASRLTGMKLLIVGKSVDQEYLSIISAQARSIKSAQLSVEFLSPSNFEMLLTSCRAILLPYSQFDAQSGVLARAMEKRVTAIASDLSSLQEQAGDSDTVFFFNTGSAEDLSRKLEMFVKQPRTESESKFEDPRGQVSILEWDAFASSVQTGW